MTTRTGYRDMDERTAWDAVDPIAVPACHTCLKAACSTDAQLADDACGDRR